MPCHFCGTSPKQLFHCKGCYGAIYCGDTCQEKAWEVSHSRFCYRLNATIGVEIDEIKQQWKEGNASLTTSQLTLQELGLIKKFVQTEAKNLRELFPDKDTTGIETYIVRELIGSMRQEFKNKMGDVAKFLERYKIVLREKFKDDTNVLTTKDVTEAWGYNKRALTAKEAKTILQFFIEQRHRGKGQTDKVFLAELIEKIHKKIGAFLDFEKIQSILTQLRSDFEDDKQAVVLRSQNDTREDKMKELETIFAKLLLKPVFFQTDPGTITKATPPETVFTDLNFDMVNAIASFLPLDDIESLLNATPYLNKNIDRVSLYHWMLEHDFGLNLGQMMAKYETERAGYKGCYLRSKPLAVRTDEHDDRKDCKDRMTDNDQSIQFWIDNDIFCPFNFRNQLESAAFLQKISKKLSLDLGDITPLYIVTPPTDELLKYRAWIDNLNPWTDESSIADHVIFRTFWTINHSKRVLTRINSSFYGAFYRDMIKWCADKMARTVAAHCYASIANVSSGGGSSVNMSLKANQIMDDGGSFIPLGGIYINKGGRLLEIRGRIETGEAPGEKWLFLDIVKDPEWNEPLKEKKGRRKLIPFNNFYSPEYVPGAEYPITKDGFASFPILQFTDDRYVFNGWNPNVGSGLIYDKIQNFINYLTVTLIDITQMNRGQIWFRDHPTMPQIEMYKLWNRTYCVKTFLKWKKTMPTVPSSFLRSLRPATPDKVAEKDVFGDEACYPFWFWFIFWDVWTSSL